MRVLGSDSSVAFSLNYIRCACDIVMSPINYFQLIKNGFRPKEFIYNNKVKILIELSQMDDVDNISSNIEDKQNVTNIWFHFDNESKFDDLVKFTDGAVFKDSIGYCLRYGNKIGYFNIGDYIGKREDGSLLVLCAQFRSNINEVGIFPIMHVQIPEIKCHSFIKEHWINKFDYFPDLLNKPKRIRTQDELDNERLTEIVDAIVRYRKSEMAVPTEWIQEYNTIIERIKNNTK
ncbi:hypothetical protein [Myroides odoratus]|uniref:Uncharacterized protein n=1 Tax=Myroides odoratus TaxID=256 RepID=A0A378RPQ2_MYROD|nr:hypothetical protein [Myroides odoratus]QQU05579.1 hypothetical protein I6I89_02880 [Myroides odoratus]STZ28339.1 Uncharacterised protein [Myroides odoratus]